MKKTICLILFLSFVLLSSGFTNLNTNPFNQLKAPSFITKIGSEYFIVDCYNNQVIYNNNLRDKIGSWQVMTSDINRGHTIASDGVVYLIDDTDNHRVLVMQRKTNHLGLPYFVQTQVFENVGNRPHYIYYHKESATFYAWSSMTGEMYLFQRNPDTNLVSLLEIRSVPQLSGGAYVRSFTIIGDKIYFVSGLKSIIKLNLNNFRLLRIYLVPEDIAGMVQLTKIEDYFYITISNDFHGNQDYATFIRTDDLRMLQRGEYEDIYHHFAGDGTPYNMTKINNRWYLTEIRWDGCYIWSFAVKNNELTDVRRVY